MKKIDYIILAVILFAVVITFFVITGKNKNLSTSPVEAVQKVQFNVTIKGATITQKEELFNVGEKSFLTIRNVPYKELLIVETNKEPKKVAVSANNSQNYVVINDVSTPNQFDYTIKLEDEAKITSDGAVVGGNKIKIGIPVVLEGFNYKLSGTVSSIDIIQEKED